MNLVNPKRIDELKNKKDQTLLIHMSYLNNIEAIDHLGRNYANNINPNA
jgi:hypothetical protein